jgi:hypothetical protein
MIEPMGAEPTSTAVGDDGVTTQGTQLDGDRFEPNNSFSDATSLGEVVGRLRLNDLSIHSASDRDFFRFQTAATGGSDHFVQVLFSHAQGDIDIQLYDANRNLLARAESVTDHERISMAGRPAGVYYLEVYGWSGATNSYDLIVSAPEVLMPDRFEPNGTFGTASDLGQLAGQRRFDHLTIHNASDRDFFQFHTTAPAGSDHYVEVRFSHAAGEVEMQLYDANRNLIGRSVSVTDHERISLAGSPAGAYYVEVYGWAGATNTYELIIAAPDMLPADRFEPNNSMAAATDLGQIVGSVRLEALTIHSTTDRDFFRFQTTATGSISDYVEILFSHGAGNLNMQLYDADRRMIDRAVSTTDNERISLAGRPAGTYFVEIYGRVGATNAYELVVAAPAPPPADRFEPNNSMAAATNLGQVAGSLRLEALTIHSTTDRDFFRFQTTATGGISDYVEILFSHDAGNLNMQLYDADRRMIDRAVSTTDDERISLAGRPAGTYFVEVYGRVGATNVYELVVAAPNTLLPDRFESNNSLATATNLGAIAGAVRLDDLTIHNTTDRDFFRFDLVAAASQFQYIQAQFSHAAGDIDMRLYDAGGRLLRSAVSVTDHERISLEGLAAGRYYLEVYGYAGATNRYDLLIMAPPHVPHLLLPDLVVWPSEAHGYLYDYELDRTTIAGRTLLRFTTTIANIGAGPLEMRGGAVTADGSQLVYQRIYRTDGSFEDRLAGSFVYHAGHGHIHVEDFSQYNLRAVTAGGGVGALVASGHKVSFALMDLAVYDLTLPGAAPRAHYRDDGQIQGISAGWADVYRRQLPDQWIDITGLPSGTYWLEVLADPLGNIREVSENNNIARVLVRF